MTCHDAGRNDEVNNSVFQVKADRTLETTLDLLTRRRAFGVVSVSSKRASQLISENLEHRQVRTVLQETGKDSDSNPTETRVLSDEKGCFYLLSQTGSSNSTDEEMLLFVGEDISSRDDDDRMAVIRRQLEVYGVTAEEVSFPTIRELYALAEGRTLELSTYARDEEEAIQIWANHDLRLDRDPRRRLYYYDESSMTLDFVAVNQDDYGKSPVQEVVEGVDPADFTSYHEMMRKMKRVTKGLDSGVFGYGDDDLVEFALLNGEEITRCICTRFYSNHCWAIDPSFLLLLKVKARVLPETCDADSLRFSHPTKGAERMSDSRRYLLDSIVVCNDMKPKFSSGRTGKDKKPDTLVSADREWDNLVDFFQWVNVYRKEINLL